MCLSKLVIGNRLSISFKSEIWSSSISTRYFFGSITLIDNRRTKVRTFRAVIFLSNVPECFFLTPFLSEKHQLSLILAWKEMKINTIIQGNWQMFLLEIWYNTLSLWLFCTSTKIFKDMRKSDCHGNPPLPPPSPTLTLLCCFSVHIENQKGIAIKIFVTSWKTRTVENKNAPDIFHNSTFFVFVISLNISERLQSPWC